MILGSVFFVLKRLIDLYEILVFGSTVVKKRRYWASVIYGDKINAILKKGNG